MTASQRIAQERKEQIEKHGFTAAHDDNRNDGYFVNVANAAIAGNRDHHGFEGADPALADRICAKPEVERLVIAAALLHAERDRIDRALDGLMWSIDSKTGAGASRQQGATPSVEPSRIMKSYRILALVDARGKLVLRRENNGWQPHELAAHLLIAHNEVLAQCEQGMMPITERIVVTEVKATVPAN